MLKEVTCSCFWGEGIRVVRLKEKVREASCMNACRFFLLTSLAFPYIKKFIIVPVLKFLVHMEEKKKPAMANLFSFILLIPNQKECRAVLKFVLLWAVPIGLSSSGSVLIGF